MAAQEIKKIAIVLSGGLARGASQLSFAREVIKKIGYERICVISSSSIGAINSYAISVKNYDHLIEFYENLDCDGVRHFMKKIKNDLFNDVFNRIEGDKMHVPTYVTATKLLGIDCHYFCLNHMPREDVKAVVNASMSFPIINGPLRFNHHLWIDGGATDNVPVLPVTYFDPDMVIILHCYPKYYPPADLYTKLRKEAIVIDVDITLALPKTINSFALSKTDFKDMVRISGEEGRIFAEQIFKDFDMKQVKERCFEYTNSKLDARRIKGGDGLMGFVDIINALYLLKDNIV